ncbi:MAG: FkbM family methyltransferase [Flavobacteriales bacterium]
MNPISKILINKKSEFEKVCKSNFLELDYVSNRAGLGIFYDIFQKREYSDYFPFYEDCTIVDIGGHFGYFSLFALKNSGVDSKIYVFEPDPENFKVLSENIKNSKIISSNKGVSSFVGATTLYLGNSTNHSIISDYALNNPETKIITIQTVSLAYFMQQNGLSQIDFLKMDCEGAEYDIILNSDDKTLQKVRVYSLEFHDTKRADQTANKLIERLSNLGYKVAKFAYEPTNMGLNYGKLIMVK